MSISAIIITKNEANNIVRCLNSLSFTDEQIVVDAESTDNTTQLASRLGARVFTRPWPGYGPQRNFGLQQARHDWLLFIDADEEVTSKLRYEIQKVIIGSHNFYWTKIITVFLGQPLKHLYGHNIRLFKKSAGRWTDALVHEQVQTTNGQILKLGDKQSAILKSSLLHHSHSTIRSYLDRMHHYTTLDAKQIHKTGHHRSGQPVKSSFLLPYRLAIKQFIKLYFYRRGFLDGYPGFMWCLLSSYYEYEMAQKYLALCV